MPWLHGFSIFVPQEGEEGPFRVDSRTGKATINPDWHEEPIAEPGRMLRLDTVMLLTGFSRTTLWRMERAGEFPKRQRIGTRAVAWLESDVRAWIASRGLARENAPARRSRERSAK